MPKKAMISRLVTLKPYHAIQVINKTCNMSGVPLIIQTKPLQKPLTGKNFEREPKEMASPNGKEIKRVMANSKTVLPNPLINLLNNTSKVM
jgi:hypothetical protein